MINPDLLAALWEIKRLRLLAMQMYQVSFELKCPQALRPPYMTTSSRR